MTISSVRPIGTLLNLDTYQGMTDEEIQSVIDYYVERARQDEVTKTMQASYMVNINEVAEKAAKAAEDSNNILKQLLAKPLDLVSIDSAEVTANE